MCMSIRGLYHLNCPQGVTDFGLVRGAAQRRRVGEDQGARLVSNNNVVSHRWGSGIQRFGRLSTKLIDSLATVEGLFER